ncbi:MAG: DUF4040 domain-containing protein [Nitrososphaerota archaeon]|nr:DUF4040 domain-containing protein [Nitrososphaerales archaeon]MDW8044497.1 DUF4040 domain-containing protein [Nitrososphaerota archaeon]
MLPIHEIFLLFLFVLAVIFSLLAIMDRDLLKSVVYSAAFSITFALSYYLLMAPDIALAYIAVGVGISTVLLLYGLSKTERFEEA